MSFDFKSKLISIEKICTLREELKDKTVVFTNGCFDLLHPGHIYLLEQAKSLGDILVVGLNSDNSVKRLKGEKRPIYSQKERAYMLSSLSCVDFIVIFEEDTPYNLIKSLKPDVLVKGNDWELDKVVGRDIVEKEGGKIFLISVLENYSTSMIIEKIKKL